MKDIPYGRQLIEDDDVAAVVAQLRDPWLTQGPTIARFEDVLCNITGAKYAVAVSSGTAALHLACLAAGVTRDDVGITTTNTFVASANCIRYCDGRPILADVDATTGLLALDQFEELVRRHHPKVVIPVDFAGSVPDLARIRDVADKVGATVIEDAAHSLGTEYVSGGVAYRAADCRHAKMATLSFHPVKHITTAEGGAITTSDEDLYRRLLDLRSHGITRLGDRLTRNDGPWYQEQQTLGFNYRLTDVQAALGVSQGAKLPRFLARRRAIAARYDEAFAAEPFAGRIRSLVVPQGVRSAYHLYVVQLVARPTETRRELSARRKALFLALRETGILPQVHYVPIHRHPDYASFVDGREFPGAEDYYASCISLPMFPALADDDVSRVIDTLARLMSS